MALLFFFPAQLRPVRGKVVRGSGAPDDVLGGAWSNGYSVTVSAEGHCLVNERMFHHRVVLGVLRDAQTPAHRPHISVQTLGCAARSDTPDLQTVLGGARSNGYSVTVSVEGHGLANERVSYHRVVLGVLRDAQTYELQSCTRVHNLR